MPATRSRLRGVFVLSGCAVAALLVARSAAAQDWTVTDLGVPPGQDGVAAAEPGMAINNSGQVVVNGTVVLDPGDPINGIQPTVRIRPFRYTPGIGFEDLNTLNLNDLHIAARKINGAGQVYGTIGQAALTSPDPGQEQQVWRFSDGSGMDLLSTPTTIAQTLLVESGRDSFTPSGSLIGVYDPTGSGFNHRGVRYIDGLGWQPITDLDSRFDGFTGIAGMNDAGQFVGTYFDSTLSKVMAFRYTDGVGIEFLPDPGLPNLTSPRAISPDGEIAGEFQVSDTVTHAFVYTDAGGAVDIHDSPDHPTSQALFIRGPYVAGTFDQTLGAWRWDADDGMVDINVDPFVLGMNIIDMNASGHLAGEMRTDLSNNDLWFWSPQLGSQTLLRDLIGDPFEQDWRLNTVRGINDRDQILCEATRISDGAARVVIIAPPCPCEIDGNDGVDVFDLLGYLDLWFGADARAERTGDEPAHIDVFDLLAYLDCWFGASSGGCP